MGALMDPVVVPLQDAASNRAHVLTVNENVIEKAIREKDASVESRGEEMGSLKEDTMR